MGGERALLGDRDEFGTIEKAVRRALRHGLSIRTPLDT
jgi:hypothetical protein